MSRKITEGIPVILRLIYFNYSILIVPVLIKSL